MPSDSKTFFITGASSGLGRALAEAALAAGHRVVGTLRSPVLCDAFGNMAPGRAFGKLLDVTDIAGIAPLVAQVEAEVGAIDVLVNNAAYGHEGILEESSLDDLRRQLEVNFFGAVAVIQAVLPYMRQRKRGRILNITSIGGYVGTVGSSFYSASKFALEGLSEALGQEVAGLGIHVTAVAPGAFRTDYAGRSTLRGERSIPDYDEVFEPVRARRRAISGKEAGGPAEAARVLLDFVSHPKPPAHLLLGRDAVRQLDAKLDALRVELDEWQDVASSTDFKE